MTDTPPYRIRSATARDAPKIAAIYAPYVRDTVITFEFEAPSADEFAARMATGDGRYPWLVAEGASGILGYAYASVFRARPAYRNTAESTVYIDQSARHRGIGRALMEALLAELRHRAFHRVIAGVTLPSDASVRLHERLGFTKVGVFREVGRKFDQWHDVGFWELPLAGTV